MTLDDSRLQASLGLQSKVHVKSRENQETHHIVLPEILKCLAILPFSFQLPEFFSCYLMANF